MKWDYTGSTEAFKLKKKRIFEIGSRKFWGKKHLKKYYIIKYSVFFTNGLKLNSWHFNLKKTTNYKHWLTTRFFILNAQNNNLPTSTKSYNNNCLNWLTLIEYSTFLISKHFFRLDCKKPTFKKIFLSVFCAPMKKICVCLVCFNDIFKVKN